MKSRETKRQYLHRLDKFLTFMGLQGTIKEKCTQLRLKARKKKELYDHINDPGLKRELASGQTN